MIPKSISPTELREKLYTVVREVARGKERYLVTPSDDEAVVMLSRREYNELVAERDLLRDLRQAEADIAAGRTHSPGEVRAFLAARRPARPHPKPRRKRR